MTTKFLIERTPILTTDRVIFTAWEPCAGHSTICFRDGQQWGRVGTEPLPPELDALPSCTDERYSAVVAWRETRYQRAYEAIEAEYPELASVDARTMGEIEILVDSVPKLSPYGQAMRALSWRDCDDCGACDLCWSGQ